MHVLVTGATGFVGSELVRALLLRGECRCLYLLIRPHAGMSAAERFARQVEHWRKFVETPTALQLRCVQIISYDLTSDGALPVVEPLDVVYHTAAVTDLGQTLWTSRRHNLQATQRALLIARHATTLKRFVHFSTAYVCGKRRGLVTEDQRSAPDFYNAYERGKWEAEESVMASNLPYTILRPSIIVGRSDNGYVWGTKVIYSVWRMWLRGLLPKAPLDAKSKVDIVPIDYVINACLALSTLAQAKGQVIHLCAGSEQVSPVAIMQAAATGFAAPLPALAPAWSTAFLQLAPGFFSFFLPGAMREILRAMLFHLPYLGQRRRQFCTQKSKILLEPLQVECPNFASYGVGLFRFCKQSAWGKRPIFKSFVPFNN